LLLVRSVLGDRGDRPINVPFWESPDIWLAPGEPKNAPAVPPSHGGPPRAGEPWTMYALVWNLGFAPLAGINVEFYWFDPSLAIDGTNAHLIGIQTCELAGRAMSGSHALVKCPKPWVPEMRNGGHECLVVRVSGIGDPLGGNAWLPYKNRHVAQRNVALVNAGADISGVLASLGSTRLAATRLQLLQVSPKEGDLAKHIIAPKMHLTQLDTHILSEVDAAGAIVPTRPTVSAAMLSPVHPLAAGGPPRPPPLQQGAAINIVNPATILRLPEAPAGPVKPAPRGTPSGAVTSRSLIEIMRGVAQLQPNALQLPAPAGNEAHALRLASYSGDQLVGGYTLLVAGAQR